MKILLIDNYDSFTFNLYHYISSLNTKVDVIRNDKITSKEIIKRKYEKIVISPGPGNPDQAGLCLEVVKKYLSQKSILGICLGHQIIAQALGGKIIRAKKLMHGKLSKIEVFPSKIFNNFPKYIIGTRYHSLIVDNKKIPKDLIITAITKDKIIMGLSHRDYDVHGIQFHPESIKTNMGKKIIKNFLI